MSRWAADEVLTLHLRCYWNSQNSHKQRSTWQLWLRPWLSELHKTIILITLIAYNPGLCVCFLGTTNSYPLRSPLGSSVWFWLSFEKIRASHKSNIFFYLTVINFFASLAGLVVSAFGYSYALINIRTANFCFAFYSLSIVLIGSGLLYLNYLLKKGR